MKLRRIAAFACASALLLQLTACGGTAQGETAASETENRAETTEAAVTEDESDGADETEAADFTYEELSDGSIKLTGYTGDTAALQIPAVIDGKQVTEIGESCFAGSLILESVHVPEGVIAVDDYAFECCSYLRKVYLPESLRSIGDGAFSGCVELTLADMQDGIETIGDGAFLHCMNLVYAELPANLKELGEFAFNYCKSLAAVRFRGDACTEIKERTFGDCENLTNVKLPGKLEKIGEYAFFNCTGITTIYIGENVQEIGKSAFQGCEKLAQFDFPCEVLEAETFKGCTSITYIGFHDNLKKIGADAFADTGDKLTQVSLPAGIEEIDEAAFDGSMITAVNLDENEQYKVLDGSLYTADMKELIRYFPSDPYSDEPETEFTVPDGVEKIGDYAFSQCRLQKIVLPDSVTEIGAYAFAYSEVSELIKPENAEIPETAIFHCVGLGYTEEQTQAETETEYVYDSDLPTVEEVIASYEDAASYTYVTNDEFDVWAEAYVACNSDIVEPDDTHNHYIKIYKGESPAHFRGMTAVQNHDPDLTAKAESTFGTGFEDLYLMMDHGLETEINRFKVQDNLVLFSGVYDSQLMAAAGTDTVPTIEELENCAGNTFTDPIQISTTTDPNIAANFGSTLFIIFAGQENIEALGGVCMDAYMGTNEKELLMNKNAEYRVIGAGSMQIPTEDPEGNACAKVRDYVMLELINE